MFGRNQKAEAVMAIEHKPSAEGPVTNQKKETVVSSDTELTGNLVGNHFRIEGVVNGNIGTENKPAERVTIDRHAQMTGDIHASEVNISGLVKGQIVAGRVTLASSARVIGNIHYHEFITQAGALISGSMVPAEQSGMTGQALSGDVLSGSEEYNAENE